MVDPVIKSLILGLQLFQFVAAADILRRLNRMMKALEDI